MYDLIYKEIIEGEVSLLVPSEKKISKKLPVFYNPIMKFNRDVSIFLLNSIDKNKMQIALPLSGTGVRAIRFFKELNNEIIEKIFVNDFSKDAFSIIKKNFEINKIDKNKYEIFNLDANKFLVNGNGFDYIDIDPFGSPNHFISNSVMRLSRNGILAVTATDTSSLCGTFSNACKRKYWAKPLRNELQHEIGLRILIRKIQLIGCDFEKALIPLLSYSKDHYMRIFFKCVKGKKACDEIIKKHNYFMNVGPLWLGNLKDQSLIKKIYSNIPEFYYEKSFLNMIYNELDIVSFYDIHSIAKKYKISPIPKIDYIINLIKEKGFKATRTHFSMTGIKSNISEEGFLKCLK